MGQTELMAMLEAFAAIYRGEDRPEAQRTAGSILAAPEIAPFGARPPIAEDRMIRDVLRSSDHPAAAALLAALHYVPWGANPVSNEITPEAAAICAIAELMGPDGPLLTPDLRLGLLYLRPDSYYPLHNHDADETYVMLAGEALWTAGDDIRMRYAGGMIHHPSLMPHAFRAGPEGFVALYRWSGDINVDSYRFLDDPALGQAPAAVNGAEGLPGK